MTRLASYYGLIKSPVDRPADQVTLDAAMSSFDIAPNLLGMSSQSASQAVMPATSSRFQAIPNQLVMSSSGIDNHVMPTSASLMSMDTAALSMSSTGANQHVVPASITQLWLRSMQLSMFSSGVGNHELLATSSQFQLQPVALSMTSQTVDAHELVATSTSVGISPDKLSFSSTTVEAHEIVATATRFEAFPDKLSFSSSGVGQKILTQSQTLFDVVPVSLSMSSSGVDEHKIPASASQFSSAPNPLSMSSSGVDNHILPASASQLAVSTVALSMSSSGIDNHVLTATLTRFSVDPVQLSMSSSGIDNHQIVATQTLFDITPVQLTFQSALSTGEAACFQGAGYMYSDQMPGGYNQVPDNGYVSLYFRYQGGNPDELFTWRNTLFQAHRADESHLEFRLEAAADGAWPDLVIESNDDTGTFWLVTDLEADGGPNLYDGNWHHLMFGNDFGGQGWYFFVDGQQYFGRTGINQGVWFKHVQANTAVGNFEEIDLVATRVQAPAGTQNLYGCVDEVTVVNDRSWSRVRTQDVGFLYNDGYGRLISDIESQNPTGLWNDVFNAWRLRQDPTEQFGYEYKDIDSTERYSLNTFGYVIVTDGIPGAPP